MIQYPAMNGICEGLKYPGQYDIIPATYCDYSENKKSIDPNRPSRKCHCLNNFKECPIYKRHQAAKPAEKSGRASGNPV